MYSEELFSSVLYGRVQYMTNEQKHKIYQLKNIGKNITEISREVTVLFAEWFLFISLIRKRKNSALINVV